ncbi:hypothetical protein EDC56_2349 [Sinobacterium caligoides]|uniref:P pilus assembly chaperone PapD n=1 Tax=Sinobacterium caligoides TaxID=933926 RepID=A0A3N2DQ39_9GAMM|nr:hypothetical protein [Sinobacterium caligoides]ROS01900.1 hypothetical protein EDC56_2349 [Sinobacterium caligoides]
MRLLDKAPALIFPLLLASQLSFAGIALSSIIIDMPPSSKPYTDITVFNDDKAANAYVIVELYEVINPGTDHEQRRFVQDPKSVSLLISPNKFVILPGGRKQVRIVDIKGPGDSDRIYRAIFKPVVGDTEAASTGVKIMIAYETLILRRPKQPDYTVQAKRQGRQLTFTHTGNSATKLESVYHCAQGQSLKQQNCTELKGARLYADNKLTLTTPAGGEVFYELVTADKRLKNSLR